MGQIIICALFLSRTKTNSSMTSMDTTDVKVISRRGPNSTLDNSKVFIGTLMLLQPGQGAAELNVELGVCVWPYDQSPLGCNPNLPGISGDDECKKDCENQDVICQALNWEDTTLIANYANPHEGVCVQNLDTPKKM